MRTAFSSPKQATAFALVILFLLAIPFLPDKKLLSRRNSTTFSENSRWARFPWLQHFLFEETNDIDIAFVGSSHMAFGIDTPYVQQKLDERLGRKTVVRSVCWLDGGFDGLYFLTRDLLSHRHVKTLVFYDECSGPNPHHVRNLAWYSYNAVLWGPRNFIQALEPEPPDDPAWVENESNKLAFKMSFSHCGNPETALGCFSSYLVLIGNEGSFQDYKPYFPKTKATPADVRFFPSATASVFRFSNQALAPGQIYFAKKFGSLAASHGCRLVALHLPQLSERTSPVMIESRNWSELMAANVCLMGIPGACLFGGLSEPETKLLYCDFNHLNANGQHYLTTLITPALIQLYENPGAR